MARLAGLQQRAIVKVGKAILETVVPRVDLNLQYTMVQTI